MKKTLTRIGALTLALVLMLALTTVAFAATSEFEGNSEEGVAGDWDNADTKIIQDKSVNIKKEIIAFNPTANTTVYAPVVTYTYTVTPASVSGLTITDEASDHASNTAVQAPVNAGITTGLVVTGANASGTAVDGSAGTATSASASLVFDNTSTWVADVAGHTNTYDIKLDFTSVPFTQPGVYRYQIAETISANSYADVAMADGNNNTVYLDVYVDGNQNVYGYVCLNANDSVTPSTTTKINGFVNGTASNNADKYYTYNLTLSKDVVNDTYAANNIAFPFTVFFNNSANYTSTFAISQTVRTGSTGLNNSAATLALTANQVALSGVALVKDGNPTAGTTVGDITFTGIPAGIDVDVYETNIATGVTYTAETSVNGATSTSASGYQKDVNVSWGSTPASAAAQSTKAAYESTKMTVDTAAIAATNEQTVKITNTLLEISPTGIVVRVAPFVLILATGIVLVALIRRRREEIVEA